MSLTRKTSEIVADDLEKQIEEKSLEPGDRLPTIDQLAIQYGVGKSTIREALSQLKARGLIQPRQGEGTFVSQDAQGALANIPLRLSGDVGELMQLLHVRRLIEGGCAATAAQEADDQDLLRLQNILKKMEAAVDNEELSRLYDIQFHMGIAQASKNPFLLRIMETMSDAMNATIRDSRWLWLYKGQQQTRQLYLDHLSIYEAIANRDAALAQRRIEAHLDNVTEALREYLKPKAVAAEAKAAEAKAAEAKAAEAKADGATGAGADVDTSAEAEDATGGGAGRERGRE
ncbi:FadR family transcriptional regulator [Alicyclobacillus curvatus]|nr:FadR family transcriptional regulator [Alicyclobacillus curvatus]